MRLSTVFMLALISAAFAPPAPGHALTQRSCASIGEVCGCVSSARHCAPVCRIVPKLGLCGSAA
ncbi:MAG: hypothetical protein WBD76_11140 [Methyloceanibacter sp.]